MKCYWGQLSYSLLWGPGGVQGGPIIIRAKRAHPQHCSLSWLIGKLYSALIMIKQAILPGFYNLMNLSTKSWSLKYFVCVSLQIFWTDCDRKSMKCCCHVLWSNTEEFYQAFLSKSSPVRCHCCRTGYDSSHIGHIGNTADSKLDLDLLGILTWHWQRALIICN